MVKTHAETKQSVNAADASTPRRAAQMPQNVMYQLLWVAERFVKGVLCVAQRKTSTKG